MVLVHEVSDQRGQELDLKSVLMPCRVIHLDCMFVCWGSLGGLTLMMGRGMWEELGDHTPLL